MKSQEDETGLKQKGGGKSVRRGEMKRENVEKTAWEKERRPDRAERGKLKRIKREQGQKAGGHKVKDWKGDGGSVSNRSPWPQAKLKKYLCDCRESFCQTGKQPLNMQCFNYHAACAVTRANWIWRKLWGTHVQSSEDKVPTSSLTKITVSQFVLTEFGRQQDTMQTSL